MMSLAALTFESCLAALRAARPLAKLFAICEAMRPARENDEAKPWLPPLELPVLFSADEPPEPPDGCPPEVSTEPVSSPLPNPPPEPPLLPVLDSSAIAACADSNAALSADAPPAAFAAPAAAAAAAAAVAAPAAAAAPIIAPAPKPPMPCIEAPPTILPTIGGILLTRTKRTIEATSITNIDFICTASSPIAW